MIANAERTGMQYYEQTEIRHDEQAEISPGVLLGSMRRHWRRGLLAAVTVAGAVAAYGMLKQPKWEASQAVSVRNEAASTWNAPGKFRHDNELKMLEETLLEVAKSRGILKATLAKVGPPQDWTPNETWPTEQSIDDLRQAVTIAPPKGSEFGKTEILYLTAKDTSRSRAIIMVEALFQQLDRGLTDLRDRRIQGTVAELDQAAELARDELEAANKRLIQMEQLVGGDLVELRLLHQSASGSSDLQRNFVDAQNELRQLRQAQTVATDLLALVNVSQANPQALLAVPNALLESQPTIRRLKDGLSDAQLRTATLRGYMSDVHPRVIASTHAEESIHRSMMQELAVASRGVEAELSLLAARNHSLEKQLKQMREQRDRLAQIRVEYTNLTSNVEHRRTLLEQTERTLSEAKANLAAARSCSLISPLGEPNCGSQPVGPGRSVIAATGVCGGLLAGVGLLFLTVPLPSRSRSALRVAPAWNVAVGNVQ